jgi:hypothetical protein
MKDPQQTLLADEEAILVAFNEDATIVATDEEMTLIAPRFDDEDTVLARPVVPLEEARTGEVSSPVSAASSYSRMPSAPRRSWLFALVLVSVLAGGLLGGAALYLYQNRSRGDGAPADSARQSGTSLPAPSQPAPAPKTETVSLPPTTTPARSEEPASNESLNATEDGASGSDTKEADTRTVGDAENVPAAAPRNEPDEGVRVGTPKRGKKGEHDAEIEQPRRPANNEGAGRRLSRADAAPDQREARRVDTIFYRPRRAARREGTRRETTGDTDRLRRIFEGQP